MVAGDEGRVKRRVSPRRSVSIGRDLSIGHGSIERQVSPRLQVGQGEKITKNQKNLDGGRKMRILEASGPFSGKIRGTPEISGAL